SSGHNNQRTRTGSPVSLSTDLNVTVDIFGATDAITATAAAPATNRPTAEKNGLSSQSARRGNPPQPSEPGRDTVRVSSTHRCRLEGGAAGHIEPMCVLTGYVLRDPVIQPAGHRTAPGAEVACGAKSSTTKNLN
ncbi:hypothetical protein CRENBAI_019434, partial [Crenichthys baileyi]